MPRRRIHGWRDRRLATDGRGISSKAGTSRNTWQADQGPTRIDTECAASMRTQVMDSQMKLPLSPGDVVAGRYRVEHAIGAGGMGSVMAARDLQTGASVA